MKFLKPIFLTFTLLFIFSNNCFALVPATFVNTKPLPTQMTEGESTQIMYVLQNINSVPIDVTLSFNSLPEIPSPLISCGGDRWHSPTTHITLGAYGQYTAVCILQSTFTAKSVGAYSQVWATAQTSGFGAESPILSTQILPRPTVTVTPTIEPLHCTVCTGTTSPNAPVQVSVGNTMSFSLNPNAGAFISAVNSTCGGTLNGSTYTTNAVNADCTVDAAFIQEYSGLTYQSGPYDIVTGHDGNLWFTELYGDQIGKITPNGVITEYPIPSADTEPNGITAGPDGDIWFTEFKGDQIGKITPDGRVTEYAIPTADSKPSNIVADADGNLWFTEQAGNKIGKMSPSGTMITEYTLAIDSEPNGIVAGPDGNMWFTEYTGNHIGKITPEGVITEYAIPTNKALPVGIALGPDGNLWFTEEGSNNIGKITPSGVITEYPIPTAGAASYGITAGPDGNVWFTESNENKISKITPSGVITEYPTQAGSRSLHYITLGPDGNLWFPEGAANKIGVL